MPKSVLNATRVIKVTQTTKKYERDTIIENQPTFRRNSNFSDMSVFLPHRWTMGVHGKAFLDPNFTHGWTMHGSPWDLSTGTYMRPKRPVRIFFGFATSIFSSPRSPVWFSRYFQLRKKSLRVQRVPLFIYFSTVRFFRIFLKIAPEHI